MYRLVLLSCSPMLPLLPPPLLLLLVVVVAGAAFGLGGAI